MAGRGRPRRFDREAALATAMAVFWEHGYEGTSLNMLTAAMGITPTSLYSAFGSKDALFKEAVDLYADPENSHTSHAMQRPRTRDAVEAMLRDNADAYIDPSTPPGCMVVLAATNLGAGHEHIGAYLSDQRKRDLEQIRERVVRGIGEGDLPAGADAAVMAAFAFTVLEGLSIQARDGCSGATMRAVIDAAMMGWDGLVRRWTAVADGA